MVDYYVIGQVSCWSGGPIYCYDMLHCPAGIYNIC